MELNSLYKFDFNILYDSKIEGNVLKCSTITCDLAREKVEKRDSLLFEQINILKNGSGLEEILVIFDFSEYIKNHSMHELDNIEFYEIKVHKIEDNKETDKEITIVVTDFLKSNSMSKDCEVYYINTNVISKNGNNLYDELKPRVFFDFDNQKTVLSKLYAYSGTLCSDCTLLDDIKLNEDEIVVIDDKNYIEKADCLTMVSLDFIYNELKKIANYIIDNPKKSLDEILEYNACLEMKSLFESMNDYGNDLSDDLKSIIIKYNSINVNDKSIFKKELSQLINSYSKIGAVNDEIEWKRVFVKNYPFDLNLFDGEGLISKEFCEELQKSLCNKLKNDKYLESTSFQIRLPYVKGMVHSCDIKGFFKDKGLTEIQHVILNNGKKYDINKVKIVLTKSQFKLENYIKEKRSKVIRSVSDYIRIINDYSYSFGVIDANKLEKNTCSLEYQFISTLPLEYKNIVKIYDDNKWIINLACSKKNVLNDLKNENSYWSKKEIEMYKLNKDFYFSSKRYKSRKNNIYSRLKHKALFSKFEVHGSRRYLASDLLELLYQMAYYDYKKFDEEKWLWKNQYYMPTKMRNYNQSIFLRSPHYSRNEIVLLNKMKDNSNLEREKYFSHLLGVVMINPRSLASERLGGADYDGDTVLVVNDSNILSCVTKEMIKYEDSKIKYKYPACKIPSLKGVNMYYNTYSSRLECFENTFSSRVGQLSNEALIKSIKAYGKDKKYDEEIMADYTILNGLEIDSAKSGKKPKIVFSKGKKDKLMTLFLEAKKEYDEHSNLKKMNLLLEKIDSSDIAIYDPSGYDLDEDEINAFNYGYNILAIAKTISYISLFNNKECDNFYVDYDKLKAKDFVKALAIASVYTNVNKLIRRSLSNKAKTIKKDQVSRIYDQLSYIALKNNLNLDVLLDSFNMDNIDAFKKIEKYVSDDSYHYLKNEKEKLKYLENFFDVKDKNILKMLTDFTDEGYRLLFILLNYYLNKITKIELNVSSKEREILDKKIQYLDDDDKKRFNNLYMEYEKDINNILTDSLSMTEDEVKNKIVEYLKDQSKSLIFDDVYFAVNIYESNMMYDVFFDIFKNYLGGNQNEKNN